MRRINLEVNHRNYFRRIDKFLRKALKDLSLGSVYFLLRKGMVKVNKKRVRKPSYKLTIGDEVSIDIPDSFQGNIMKKMNVLIPRKMRLNILYEDEYIIILSKPPGISIHPGKGTYGPTLIEGLLHYGMMNEFEPFLVHRLDKHTSGTLLIAKNREVARIFSQMLKDRKIHKEYLALVKGKTEKNGLIDVDIDNRSAKTEYEVLNYFLNEDTLSFVKVRIETGRKHQIRRHFAMIHHPIVGDDVYGDREFNRYFRKKYNLRRYFLHAFKIEFKHPFMKREISVEAPLSEDLSRVLERLGNGD